MTATAVEPACGEAAAVRVASAGDCGLGGGAAVSETQLSDQSAFRKCNAVALFTALAPCTLSCTHRNEANPRRQQPRNAVRRRQWLPRRSASSRLIAVEHGPRTLYTLNCLIVLLLLHVLLLIRLIDSCGRSDPVRMADNREKPLFSSLLLAARCCHFSSAKVK